MDVKCLGHVAEGAVVKIVDPDSGNICGPNEVHMYAFFFQNRFRQLRNELRPRQFRMVNSSIAVTVLHRRRHQGKMMSPLILP